MIRLLSAYIKTLLILIYDRRKDISGLYLVGSETAIDQFDIILIVDADDAGTEIFSFPGIRSKSPLDSIHTYIDRICTKHYETEYYRREDS